MPGAFRSRECTNAAGAALSYAGRAFVSTFGGRARTRGPNDHLQRLQEQATASRARHTEQHLPASAKGDDAGGMSKDGDVPQLLGRDEGPDQETQKGTDDEEDADTESCKRDPNYKPPKSGTKQYDALCASLKRAVESTVAGTKKRGDPLPDDKCQRRMAGGAAKTSLLQLWMEADGDVRKVVAWERHEREEQTRMRDSWGYFNFEQMQNHPQGPMLTYKDAVATANSCRLRGGKWWRRCPEAPLVQSRDEFYCINIYIYDRGPNISLQRIKIRVG